MLQARASLRIELRSRGPKPGRPSRIQCSFYQDIIKAYSATLWPIKPGSHAIPKMAQVVVFTNTNILTCQAIGRAKAHIVLVFAQIMTKPSKTASSLPTQVCTPLSAKGLYQKPPQADSCFPHMGQSPTTARIGFGSNNAFTNEASI